MNTAIPDRYLPAADFEKLAQDFDFPVEVWTVAAELTGVTQATSPAELEKLTGLGAAQVKEALERLLAKKLVRQNVVSWKEFNAARTQASGTDQGTPAASPAPVNTPAPAKTPAPAHTPAPAKTKPAVAPVEPAASPAVQAPAPAPAAVPAPAVVPVAQQPAAPSQPVTPAVTKPEPSEPPVTKSPASEPVALRLGSIVSKAPSEVHTARISLKPSPNAPVAAIAPEPTATPEPAAALKPAAIPAASPEGIAIITPARGCLLRPILSKIESIKGGGVEGQLLVYQVFLRVPFQMLHDEGIKSLQLVDDKTTIRNPELHAAIVKAAKEVTGIDLPPFETES